MLALDLDQRIIISSCRIEEGEKMANNGDTVKVQYTGKLSDGTVFDTSIDKEPLEFTVGSGMVIPGFDQAVIGMNPGESKTIEIPMTDAYGPYCNELVQEVNRSEIPSEVKLEIGQRLQAQRQDGQIVMLVVTNISDSTVTIDANHPLAGKDLTFNIELIEVC
jgi:FKBP-type peptidyl-prolyl cis-trans isomerase 2